MRTIKEIKGENIEKINCINCGKLFPRRKYTRRIKSKIIGVRGYGYKNCSAKCSREWQNKKGWENK